MPNFITILVPEYLETKNLEYSETTNILWGQISKEDNDPEYFWNSFLEFLTYWDEEFVQMEKRFPCPLFREEDKKNFFDRLKKAIETTPLHMVFTDIQFLEKGMEAYEFLQDMLVLNTKQCVLSLLRIQDSENINQAFWKYQLASYTHLYYTKTEERSFYSNSAISLDDVEAEMIREYTNGWIPMVRVVCRMLKQKSKRILLNFEYHLTYWLENEYLPQFIPSEQQLMYNLSLLKLFPLQLVQSLKKCNGNVLARIMQSSPIYRHDEEKSLYTFPAYVRETLQNHQVLLDSRDKEQFYLQVATWFQEHEMSTYAIEYFQKAKAYSSILELIYEIKFPYSRDVAEVCLRAIQDMPSVFRNENPILEVFLSISLCCLYRYQNACRVLEKFCKTFDLVNQIEENMASILGEAYIILGYISFWIHSDLENTIRCYRRAGELLPNGSRIFRGGVNLFADIPTVKLLNAETGALQKSVDYYAAMEPYYSNIMIEYNGLATLAQAERNFYTHNFREVESYARKAITKALDSSRYDLICAVYFLLMRFYMAKGNYQKLIESYSLLQRTAESSHYSTFFSLPENAKSWLMLQLERPNKVAKWLRDESLYRRTFAPWNYGRDRVLRCYYLLETNQYDSVIAYAESSKEWLSKRNLKIITLYLTMLEAIAYYEIKEKDQAIDRLKEVYDWICNNDMVLLVAEFGRYIAPLFKAYRESGDEHIPSEWLDKMQKAAKSYETYCYRVRKNFDMDHGDKKNPTEVLTPSEWEVLELISHGFSMKKIAETKERKEGAIRAMAKRIYDKLEVSGKAEAVRLAYSFLPNEEQHINENES